MHTLLRLRRWLRSSEAAMIVIAIVVGAMAGLVTALQSVIAHGLQHLFYGVGINRLSALASIRHPLRLLALPAGGLILALINWRLRLARAPVDVVEANALHGGLAGFDRQRRKRDHCDVRRAGGIPHAADARLQTDCFGDFLAVGEREL